MKMAIPIVIWFLLSLGLSIPLFPPAALAAEQQQQSTTVIVDGACGKEHSVSYTITGGAVASEIKADPAVFSLTVSLAESSNDGTLTITIPQQLVHDENAGRYPDLAVFIDEVGAEYNIQNITENNITVEVGFPAGAKTIDIIGGYILAFTPYTNNLTIDIEGRQFPVNTYSAPICSYEFSAEQKKLTIHSDNAAEFTVTFPKEMLGGPYSVFLDEKHREYGIDYSPRYYSNSANENITSISVSMLRERADTIEIVGTTALVDVSTTHSSHHALSYLDYDNNLIHVYNLTMGNQSYPIRYGFSSDSQVNNGGNNTAVVESMHSNYTSKSITVIIHDNDNSTAVVDPSSGSGGVSSRFFLIELPRQIIAANTTEISGGCSSFSPTNNTIFWNQEHDIPYNVIVSRLSPDENIEEEKTASVTYEGDARIEVCGNDNRTLAIEYEAGGKSMIVIQGTAMVPEFGSLSVVIAALSTGTVLFMMSRLNRKAARANRMDV